MSTAGEFSGFLGADALKAPPSGIVEVMRHGFGRPGLVALWAGEGDLPTPDFIREAAAKSLSDGETFYTQQAGIPPLREALAHYHDRLYGPLFGASHQPGRFLVTGSGMHAITLALSAVTGPGDSVIIPTPAWPNFPAAVGVRGARAIEVPMQFSANTGWQLDPERLEAAIEPSTRAMFINSPSNPTGWTADETCLKALLEIARRRGLWIIADEIYARFYYDNTARHAPSFRHLITADDRVIFVNTFSKNWAMTGWRIGWIEVPAELGEVIQNLIQYSSSGTAVFMQRAAIKALQHGDDFIDLQVNRARNARDIVKRHLEGTGRVKIVNPPGAFYHFFSIDGHSNTRRLGLQLVDEANIGVAPGDAFGTAGRGYIRMCFAGSEEQITIAAERLQHWVNNAKPAASAD